LVVQKRIQGILSVQVLWREADAPASPACIDGDKKLLIEEGGPSEAIAVEFFNRAAFDAV